MCMVGQDDNRMRITPQVGEFSSVKNESQHSQKRRPELQVRIIKNDFSHDINTPKIVNARNYSCPFERFLPITYYKNCFLFAPK